MVLMLYPTNIKIKRKFLLISFVEKVIEFIRETCGKVKFAVLHKKMILHLLFIIFHI
ncbi:MAG: hypothetical protein IJ475_01010 [Bacilli bacterium]|nr:hypothetical protein [Bacilli bacterium]